MEKKLTSFYVFTKIILYLNDILSFESYSSARDEYIHVLNRVEKWQVEYLKNNSLLDIDSSEMNEIYECLEDLKTKWLFSYDLGSESELSDYVVIWMIELMNLRNKELEEGDLIND